jgi:hypothetical protein
MVERRLDDAGRHQAGQGERLLAPRLGVADPQLHGAERVVRANTPPQLRRLDDRVGLRQQVDEVRVRRPVAERLVDAAAGKGASEDLGAH